MPSEEQTKADLLTLIQGRNQRIAELELLVLDLNRQIQEGANHANGKTVQVQKTEDKDKKVFGQKEEKKVE
tara:strand:+ start:24577 stop:24789 length:213 start_codon:yes stop_codon:yes gene_type:complete